MHEHGLDGYLRLMRDWLAPWESYTIAGDEFYDLEPDRVAVTTRHRGRMKDGGAEILTEGVDLWTLRDGRLLRLEAYLDREMGLEAAGLGSRRPSAPLPRDQTAGRSSREFLTGRS